MRDFNKIIEVIKEQYHEDDALIETLSWRMTNFLVLLLINNFIHY